MCGLLLSEHWFFVQDFQPRKALQTGSPLRRSLISQNSFFSISGNKSTELVPTTMAKASFHKEHKEEFEGFQVQLYHHILEHTTSPLGPCSGNQLFYFHSQTSLMIRAQKLKRSLFALGTWFGAGTFHCQKGPQRYSPFRRWQIQHDHAFVEQEGKISTGLFCTKRGRISLTKIPEKKILQALWFILTFTSLYKVHVQCLFAQESHP